MIEQNKNMEKQETKIITDAKWKLLHNLIHKGFTDKSIMSEVFRLWLIFKSCIVLYPFIYVYSRETRRLCQPVIGSWVYVCDCTSLGFIVRSGQ